MSTFTLDAKNVLELLTVAQDFLELCDTHKKEVERNMLDLGKDEQAYVKRSLTHLQASRDWAEEVLLEVKNLVKVADRQLAVPSWLNGGEWEGE